MTIISTHQMNDVLVTAQSSYDPSKYLVLISKSENDALICKLSGLKIPPDQFPSIKPYADKYSLKLKKLTPNTDDLTVKRGFNLKVYINTWTWEDKQGVTLLYSLTE